MGTRAHAKPRGTRGVTATDATPVVIRDRGPDQTLDHDRLRALLGRQLGKFSLRVAQVVVTVQDESGPVGQPVVRATVTLSHQRVGQVAVSARGATSWAAAAAAVRSCERSVRRRVERDLAGRR